MSPKSSQGGSRPPGGPIKVKGLTGIVTFDGQTVTITRKGLSQFNSGRGQAEVSLPVEEITGLDWTAANFITNGFIRFLVAGEIPKPLPSFFRLTAASGQDNSVVFKQSALAGFQVLRDAVSAAIRAR